jgi:predicted homoserine dehydrogenase-like protein
LFSDGDQPGAQMNLFRFACGLGIKPVLCNNSKGLRDPIEIPERGKRSPKNGGRPALVASFADGTKIFFEQALVANGTGMRGARRGMLGPDFSHGNPDAAFILQQPRERGLT